MVVGGLELFRVSWAFSHTCWSLSKIEYSKSGLLRGWESVFHVTCHEVGNLCLRVGCGLTICHFSDMAGAYAKLAYSLHSGVELPGDCVDVSVSKFVDGFVPGILLEDDPMV